MTQSLLIYDGSNSVFRSAADAVSRRLSGVKLVPWQSGAVQRFLDAQFDDRPFAFILIDGDSVHVGADTVERVLEKQQVNRAVVDFVTRTYPSAAGPFGRVVHGAEPADLHDTFALTAAAREHLDPLRQSYDIPVETE
ncbi:MAG: hypothetical protein V5A45_09305 [Haloarculaceae archaeon]